MKIPTGCLLFTLFTASVAFAQGSSVGKYRGSYDVQTNKGHVRFGVTLAITSVEDGKLKGVGTLHDGVCRGSYPVEGLVKDNAIGVYAIKKGGPAGDCGFAFKGKIDGNRLVGNLGPYEVVLRK